MISLSVSAPKFFAAWVPAAMVSAHAPPPVPVLGQIFFIHVAGIPVPIVTALIAALGIILARPFARRAETDLGWPLFILVTAIMLIVTELWVIETRPGWLFAFVVSIGMGFAGYSLIEMFGEQVKNLMKGILFPLGLLQKFIKYVEEFVASLTARRKKSADTKKDGTDQ